MTVYGDESGWTGPDLLDTEQPVLVVSTLRLDPNEADSLRERFFARFSASEVKFSQLTGSDEGKDAILEFLTWVTKNQEQHRSFYIHKRFALIGKLVDTIVETAAYESGHDLYRDGGHIFLMNALHHGLPTSAGEEIYFNLLKRWQDLARRPSKATLDHFYSLVSSPDHPRRAQGLLQPLKRAREALNEGALLWAIKRNDLDVLTAAVWAVAYSWNRSLGDKRIEVVFDAQSKLKSQGSAWQVLLDPEFEVRPPIVARLPVVDSFAFGKSEEVAGIQLADVLCGSMRSVLTGHAHPRNSRTERPGRFNSSLSALVEELSAEFIWPGPPYHPDNSVTDYSKSQELIDATTRSVARNKGTKKR